MVNREELIKALMCSSRVKTDEDDCSKCPYRYLEEVDPKYPLPPDIEQDGRFFWESCDVEKMAVDAANMLAADQKALHEIHKLAKEQKELELKLMEQMSGKEYE